MKPDPAPEDVDQAIQDIALRELDDMPVGSTVMINECIGFKKMSLWWNIRVWGVWRVLKVWWRKR